MMKPILFNTEMVRAILDGRKTCTRRLIKPQPEGAHTILDRDDREHTFQILCGNAGAGGFFEDWEENIKAPYWPGDILYVRETWQFIPCIDCGAYLDNMCRFKPVVYEDKYSVSEGCFIYREDCVDEKRVVWHPSIHMPKEAARIFLRVKDVRVERLLTPFFSDGAAIFELRKEGMEIPAECVECIGNYGTPSCIDVSDDTECGILDEIRGDFFDLWDKTVPKHPNKFKSYPYYWKDNPWVWVIEFERCKKPEEVDYEKV